MKYFFAIVIVFAGLVLPQVSYSTGGHGCVLEITKSVSKTEVKPGDSVEFTLDFKNSGTGNCTGGGVRVQDVLDSNLTFVSATKSSNVTLGYYNGVPLYNSQNNTVSFNANTLSPGEVGWAKIVATVNQISACGITEIKNKAQITSKEIAGSSVTSSNPSVWVTSNEVVMSYNKVCTPPLTAICEADPASVLTNEPVTWSAFATGGTGSYTYAWSGDQGLSGAGDTVTHSYGFDGTKQAQVIVTSGSDQYTANCSVKVTEQPLSEACPFVPALNRTIISFGNKKIFANRTPAETYVGPVSVTVPSGTYVVSLASYDGYTGRRTAVQTSERWFLELANSTQKVESGIIADVPDPTNSDYAKIEEMVNQALYIPFDVTHAYARHAVVFGGISGTGANSLNPICASLDLVNTETDISLVCEADPASVLTNEPVTWSAFATGGTGSYTYAWSGDQGLSGTSSSLMKSYTTTGVKNASVTVTSGTKTKTVECSVQVTQSTTNPPLNAVCEADPASVLTNEPVTWSAFATGGTGSYTYAWSGDGGVNATTSTFTNTYSTSGTKKNEVIVVSGSDQVTRECTVEVTSGGTGGSPFDAVCKVSASSVGIGSLVTYTAEAVGGTGNYTYLWSGDQVDGNTQAGVNTSYTSVGTKNASVAVTSGSETISLSCSTLVTGGGGGCVGGCGGGGPTPPVVTLLKKFFPAEVVPQDEYLSIYLSAVPYTGLGPTAKTMIVILSALVLSAGIAFLLSKKIATPGVAPLRTRDARTENHPLASFGIFERSEVKNTSKPYTEFLPTEGEIPSYMRHDAHEDTTNVNYENGLKATTHTVHSDARALLTAIAHKDSGSAFAIIRAERANEVKFAEYMTEVVSALDAVYRERIEGKYANADHELSMLFSRWSSEQLERLITQLLRAVNMTYADAYTATQLALVSALNTN